MGDPLSVAGTAVGVVSLGLQVTGGLIKYHSNFTSYQEDITRITQSSERLCELLECLNDVLTKEEPEHSAVLEQVHRSVSACKGGLRLLKREVEKNRTIKLPVNTEDKARIIAKRLLYPFKKDTLHGVQVQLYALEDRLSFAVSLWNREISSMTFEIVTIIGRTTRSVDRRAQIIEEKLDRIHRP
ncbi:hypothetical protein IFR04_007555 [Cadophora malorum]|uniref:Fungal N-terminal domain-containing protein n=1 Tax=Cadophora malorum TaxID=108018 RepID=A0A8H7W6F4_9HELO|nr:hypothetical protein IFR04_007555 [Cadophora malorum]